MTVHTHRPLTQGFTLMELILIIGLIALLLIGLLALLNPGQKIKQAHDTKRKTELQQLSKSFEEYYNDNEEYPTSVQICYNEEVVNGDSCSCHICGKETGSPSFSPYLTALPCDPTHPTHRYLYEYECSEKSWFRLYAQLSTTTSAYDYGISSPNVTISLYPTAGPTPTSGPTPTDIPAGSDCEEPIYCKKDGLCNICGTPGNCADPSRCTPGEYYNNSGCTNACTL